MIDLDDFKFVKNGAGRLKHFRVSCNECLIDRGYTQKRYANKLCNACSKRKAVPCNVDITDFITKNHKGNTQEDYIEQSALSAVRIEVTIQYPTVKRNVTLAIC